MTVASPPKSKPDPARDQALEIVALPVNQIEAAPNVRDQVGDVDELADSIRTHGLLQPIRVRQIGDRRYALIFGQRRLAAARLAGLDRVLALVDSRAEPPAPAIEQLVENIQRADLQPLEEAKAYRELLDAGLTQRELAQKLGRSQPSIADKLRLLKLPEAVKEKIASGELSASHAKAIASLPDTEQTELARRVVEYRMSAHDVEAEVRRALDRVTYEDRHRDEVRGLADAAEAALAKKKGATKEAAQLRVYDSDLAAELKRRGWAMAAKTYGYDKPKGCTCKAWNIARNYMGSQAASKVTLTGTCVVKAHYDTVERAAAAERAQRTAEYEAARAAEAKKRVAEADQLVDRIAGDQILRDRLALLALADTYAFTDVGGAFEQEILGEDPDSTWTMVAKLELDVVQRWLVRFLAGVAIDEHVEIAPADG